MLHITKNGVYNLNKNANTGSVTVLVSGNLGAATGTLSYPGGGSLQALTDGVVAAGNQYRVHIGASNPLYLEVTGADGSTDFYVETGGV